MAAPKVKQKFVESDKKCGFAAVTHPQDYTSLY